MLSSGRPAGFGVSGIPFDQIVAYAQCYEVEDFERFLHHIQAMDTALKKHAEAKADKETST